MSDTTTEQLTQPADLSTGLMPEREPHVLDRLSVIYKYRWASITVFSLVVGWLMVDSYTQIPTYRSTARVLIEDPSSDLSTPADMLRNVPQQDPASRAPHPRLAIRRRW